MTTATREKAIAEVNGDVEVAEKWTATRIVRELASSTAGLYGWLAGSADDRTGAVQGHPGHGFQRAGPQDPLHLAFTRTHHRQGALLSKRGALHFASTT